MSTRAWLRTVSVFLLLFAVTTVFAKAPDWYPEDAKIPFDEVVIGFSTLGPALNGYSAYYHESFFDYVEELGVEDNVIVTDAAADAARQANQVRNLIAQQVDVMIIWPVNGKAIVPAARQVDRAGIPLIISNSMIDPAGVEYMTAYTGPDDYGEAQKAGRMMVEALGGSGNVVMLNGTPGYQMAQLRIDGFLDVVSQVEGINILDSQPAYMSRAQGQRIMENYITKYGKKIDGVYAVDSGVGYGAWLAAREADKEGLIDAESIEFVDATMYSVVYDLIEQGKYYGSVFQSPWDDARLALKTAYLIAAGAEVPEYNYLNTPRVTKGTIDDIPRPNF